MKARLIILGFSLLLSFAMVEGGLAALTAITSFSIKTPSYSLENVRSGHSFVADLNQDFGVWHRPNHRYRHQKACFDVTYQSNRFGARDRERSLTSNKGRTILLGDSMTEGFGVVSEARTGDLLEKRLDREFLNFGTSGNFGTTQHYLLYKTLAKQFQHDQVVIGLIPSNDFLDNDYEYGKAAHASRYRPYFHGTHPHYELTYFRKSLGQSRFGHEGGAMDLAKLLLSEFTYAYNALALLIDLTAQTRQLDYSGYYDFEETQWLLMQHTLSLIQQEAEGRPVALVAMPVRTDFVRYLESGKDEPPLSTRLRAYAAQQGMRFVDLLPAMSAYPAGWEALFLTCDGHWNEQGHTVAAEQLLKALY